MESKERRIYLLRHAKSAWDEPDTGDHDRGLAPRGRQAAERMAAWCRAERIAPALVLCSTARRTRETLARLLPHLAGTARIEFEEGLYLAGADELLRRLRRVEDPLRSVMLIGHNPGMHELALTLADAGDPAALQRLRGKYPTGALAEIAFAAERWRDIAPGRGRLVRFVVPRELA